MPNTSVQLQPSSFVDSHGLLTSIQNLVTKNESLEAKVEEQKNKLELQNDKIFHLLELNQTYEKAFLETRLNNNSNILTSIRINFQVFGKKFIHI